MLFESLSGQILSHGIIIGRNHCRHLIPWKLSIDKHQRDLYPFVRQGGFQGRFLHRQHDQCPRTVLLLSGHPLDLLGSIPALIQRDDAYIRIQLNGCPVHALLKVLISLIRCVIQDYRNRINLGFPLLNQKIRRRNQIQKEQCDPIDDPEPRVPFSHTVFSFS